MTFGVYDLLSAKQFSLMESVGTMDCKVIDKDDISPLLVHMNPGEDKVSYVIGQKNLILEDLVSLEAKDGKFGLNYDYRRLFSIDRLLLGLLFGIHGDNDNKFFYLDVNDVPDSKYYKDLLYEWFLSQNSILSIKLKPIVNNRHDKYTYTIIPIPERLNVDAQTQLIQANYSSGSRTVLLWRSVAAFIGVEDRIRKCGLHQDSTVYVVDGNDVCITTTKLTVHECEGRLIPGHHLYYKNGAKSDDNYPYDIYKAKYDSLNNYLPFLCNNAGIIGEKQSKQVPRLRNDIVLMDADYLIVCGDVDLNLIKVPSRCQMTVDKTAECVTVGAGRFANRMKNGIISYYDECEALGLAVITPEEEVKLFTLIEATDKLTGGLEIKGITVTGISLNTANSQVDFYLLLGDQESNKPLKILSQKLDFEDSYVNKPRNIPLKLEPTMVAGQGRANVLVSPKNRTEGYGLKSVNLDWEQMVDAYDNGNPVTIEYLEMTMERSFPLDIPPVKCDINKFNRQKRAMENYIDSFPNLLTYSELNRSSWPYRSTENGVKQFVRTNVFGSKRSSVDLPLKPQDKQLAIDFFKCLYNEYLYHNEDISFIQPIAWTYHSEYFPKVYERLLSELNDVKCNRKDAMVSSFYSACANFLENDSHLALFMEAFFSKCDRNSSSIGNWLRSAYQILMYNTTFLRLLDIDEVYKNLYQVLDYYYDDAMSLKKKSLAQSYFIFLLKMRRYKHSFCKLESPDIKDRSGYYALNYFTMSLPAAVFSSIIEIKKLNGYEYKTNKELFKPHLLGIKYTQSFISYYDSRYFYGDYVNTIKSLPDGCFPENYMDSSVYIPTTTDYAKYSKRLFSELGIKKELRHRSNTNWNLVLKDYLNGKGNLNLPISEGDGN